MLGIRVPQVLCATETTHFRSNGPVLLTWIPRRAKSRPSALHSMGFTATEIAIDIDMPEPLTPGVPVTLKFLAFSLMPQSVSLRAGAPALLGTRADLKRIQG
jgi:hypothetical protein